MAIPETGGEVNFLGSIRSHLSLLVAAAVVPLLAAVGFGVYREFQTASESAERSVLAVAEATATSVDQFLMDIRTMLEAMAERPDVRALDPSRCDPVAVEAPLLLRQLGHSMILNAEGAVVCTSLPPLVGEDRLRDASTREYYQEVARTRRFHVGAPRLGYVSGRNVSVMASPILAEDGSFLGATTLSVDLIRLQEFLEGLRLGNGAVATIADSMGVVVARSSRPMEWIGDTLPRFDLSSPYAAGRGINRGPGIDGEDRVWGFVAVPESPWVVFAGLPTAQIFGPARQATQRAAFFGLLTLALVGLLSSFVYHRVTASIAALELGTAKAVRGGGPAPVGGLAEVARVTERFNQALEAKAEADERRRLAEEDLARTERMDAIGRLAGGVAHDFNNLITVINGQAEMLLLDLPEDGDAHQDAREILDAGERAAELTQQLLAFGRRQMIAPTSVDLSDVARRTSGILRRLLPEDIELHLDLADDLDPVRADPSQIERVVMNLVLNARDAMTGRGRIDLRTSNVQVDDGSGSASAPAPGPYVRMVVADTGSGIEPDLRDRIFEPFVSGKRSGQGTGLGLAVVFGIVTQAGGFVQVESEPGRGAEFRVHLPRATTAPS